MGCGGVEGEKPCNKSDFVLACSKGHSMEHAQMEEDGLCDKCQAHIPEGTPCVSCRKCDYDVCMSCVSGGTTTSSKCAALGQRQFSFRSNIPIRHQWDGNQGYCGEVSTIASGMLYGQYFSQYDLRAIYADSTKGSKGQTKEQYLVGDRRKDEKCATALRLNCMTWHRSSKLVDANTYLAWVKCMMRKGYPVTICVYMSGGDDDEYDHIVTVTAVESDYDDDLYRDDDIINIDEHFSNPIRASFKDIKATRGEANNDSSLKWFVPSDVQNYAIAHIGAMGEGLLPVRLDTNVDREVPEIVDGSAKRPKAVPVRLAVAVSGLQSGKRYNLYRYDDINQVPSTNFNGNSKNAATLISFTAEGETYQLTEEIATGDQRIYRCVSAEAS